MYLANHRNAKIQAHQAFYFTSRFHWGRW